MKLWTFFVTALLVAFPGYASLDLIDGCSDFYRQKAQQNPRSPMNSQMLMTLLKVPTLKARSKTCHKSVMSAHQTFSELSQALNIPSLIDLEDFKAQGSSAEALKVRLLKDQLQKIEKPTTGCSSFQRDLATEIIACFKASQVF